jgi:hypothetical protein
MKNYSEAKLEYKITRKENIIKKSINKTLTNNSWDSVKNKITKFVEKDIKTIADLQESVAGKNIAIDYLNIAKSKVEENYPVVRMYNDLKNTIDFLNKDYTKELGNKTDEINSIIIDNIVNDLNTHLQSFFECNIDFKVILLSKLNSSVKAGDKLRRHVRYFKFKEDMLDLYSVLNDDVDFLSIEHKHILSLIDACNSIADIKNFINKIKLEEIEESQPKVETLGVEVKIADSKNINNGNITSKVETVDVIKPIVVYFNNQQDRDLVANFIKEKFKASKINDKIVLTKK